MKIKILNALKTEYATMGLGEKALDGVASFLEKTITDEKDIVTRIKEDDVKAILKGIQGDSDVIRAARLKAEKELADYKKAHPNTTEPNPNPEPNNANEQILAELKAMREENKAIKEQIEANKLQLKRDAIREKAVAKLKNGQRNWDISVKDALRDCDFSENDTEDTFLEKLKSAAMESYKEHYGDGVIPGISMGSTAPQDDPNEFKAGLSMIDPALYPAKKE